VVTAVDFMQRDTSINIRHDVHQLNLDQVQFLAIDATVSVPLSVATQHHAKNKYSKDVLSHFYSDSRQSLPVE